MPAVTVVVATRNRAAELATTLRRLQALDPQPPVIVVDNASDDATGDVVQRATAHGPVQWVALAANEGAAARNVGVAMATTPYVAFCDDDSWWDADAMARAERILDDHPRVALLAGALRAPDGRPDPIVALMRDSPLGRTDGLPGPEVLGFIACGAVVRRAPYLSVGGFNPLLQIYGEETLLAYDLASRGWRSCYAPEVVAYHAPSTRRGAPPARRRRELRNAVLVAMLRRPTRRWLAATVAVARDTVRRPRTISVFAELIARAPQVVRQRRTLPQSVEDQVRVLEQAYGPEWGGK